MKRKVGMVVDEELFSRVKRAAVREKKTLSLLLQEALNEYLARLEGRAPVRAGVLSRKRGGPSR